MSFIVMGTKFGDESLRSKCVFRFVYHIDLALLPRAVEIRRRKLF